MADRFPLILNTSTNQIQEIASGDQLDLSDNNVANAGIITATTFSGNLTGNVTGNINGNLTGTLYTAAQPNITSIGTLSSLNVSGNASIGGVLTYEDVTNIDSVGVITARTGIKVLAGGINAVGVVTATSFVGDGSNLTGISGGGDKISEGNTKAEVSDSGSDGKFFVETEGSERFSIDSTGDFKFESCNDSYFKSTGDLTIDYKSSNSTKMRNFTKSAGFYFFALSDAYPVVIGSNFSSNPISFYRTGEANIGTGITLSGSTGNITASGIITATNFAKADGSSLGGVSSDAQSNTIGGTSSGASFQGTSAINNTLFGFNSGRDITTGDHNSGFGDRSLYKLTTGSDNTALGQSLYNATTGTKNVGTGNWSLFNLTTGSNNNAYGYQTLDSVTTADNNSAFGHRAAEGVTTGTNNSALGYEAGQNLTTGSNNIVIGANADASSNSVSNEITLGDANITKFRIPGINFILKDNGGTPSNGHVLTVDGNGEAGFAAASGGSVTSDGQENTVGGTNAGDSITSGTNSTHFGYNAGTTQTTSGNNASFGHSALKQATGGANNAFGYKAGEQVSTGFANSYFGSEAGSLTKASSYNTGIGNGALKRTGNTQEGNLNTGVGYESLTYLQAGDFNTAIGAYSGHEVTGSNNVCIGYQGGDVITSGSNNIVIGSGADASAATVSNEITLGNSSITKFRVPGCGGFEIDTNGHTLPGSDNASDLGSSSKRWRNIYSADLKLSNKGSANDVDNTWGDYTIQEGESDLFLINNRSGKKYKFNLTEIK